MNCAIQINVPLPSVKQMDLNTLSFLFLILVVHLQRFVMRQRNNVVHHYVTVLQYPQSVHSKWLRTLIDLATIQRALQESQNVLFTVCVSVSKEFLFFSITFSSYLFVS